ncbi:TonB-dependent receptor [Jeongeupia naejangsanensis]|uniref:TonB-dependent receptor n=1 Tax=Jeongeupia naejangsanensis TaxID=613195 RepID=A0ABS2BIE7_9NEIS|nr:TonB-dependent receptor [Jeongeupia naejangsanensis]MBM3114589.1 TonB-dependent receptor [Jeongeupia naejangsanensis]
MQHPRQRKLAVLMALGFSGAFSAPVHAQDTANSAKNPDGVELSSVVVTALRREQGIQDVPVAVTALGGAEIRNDELRTVNDITRYVPNFNGQSTEGRERPRWFLRGVGSNDPSPTSLSPIGFYLDDVYLNNVFGQGVPLFDLDRVEVLRGPQGTLWGKNTIGGAINVLSKKPGFDTDGYAKLGFGNNRSNVFEGAVGTPLVDERLAARVSVYHEQGDSSITNDYTGEQFGSFKDNAVRAQLLALTSDDSDLLLNVHARKYTGAGNPWRSTGIFNGKDLYGFKASSDVDHVSLNAQSGDEIETRGAALTGHWALPQGITLTSITGYERVDREFFGDNDASPNEVARGHSNLGSGQWSQEFRLTSSPKQALTWIAGLHLFGENLGSDAQSGTLANGPKGAAGTAYQRTWFNQDTDSQAIFGSATYNVTDRFNVTAGLRWTRERKQIDLHGVTAKPGIALGDSGNWWQQGSNGLPVTLSQQQDNTWSAPTWDFSPEYRLSDDALVFARIARGFRSGGYNTGADSDASFNTVDPEYLTEYSIGFKSAWFDKRLIFNATAFHYDYKDIQVFALAPSALGTGDSVATLSNAGKGRADGLELEFKGQPTRALSLYTNLGFLRTKYTEFDNVPWAVGNSFARAPKATAGFGGDYRVPLGDGAISLGGDLIYRAKEYFSATRQTDPNLWQDGYTLINARLAYFALGDKYSVTLWGNNLSDKQYKKLGLVPSYGAYQSLWGDERTFGLTFTGKL